MNPLIDIIILVHNKYRYTEFCLKGLLRTLYRPLHVILVNNGSEDRTPETLAEFRHKAESRDIRVSIITNEANKGAVTGRNQALEKRIGEFTVFMDNDVVPVSRTWIKPMIEFLRSRPAAGAVSPKLIYPVEPFRIQCAGCDVAPTGKVNFRGRGAERRDPRFSAVLKAQALISACMCVPSDVIENVGPFDTLFSPVQFEDIDYCYRIKQEDRDLYYYPDIEMYHFENVTTSRTPALNPVYNTVKNGMKFKKKWKHVFSLENGPDERSMEWQAIDTVDIGDIDPDMIIP